MANTPFLKHLGFTDADITTIMGEATDRKSLWVLEMHFIQALLVAEGYKVRIRVEPSARPELAKRPAQA